MLTSDLVLTRTVQKEIRPRYIDATDAERLRLAGSLIEIFTDHEGEPRSRLEEALRDFLGTGTAFLLHRGLTKLLRDRCTFETASSVAPQDLREILFTRAALAYRESAVSSTSERLTDDPASDRSAEVDPAADVVAEAGSAHRFRFDRDAVVAAVASELDITSDDVDRGLFADLKEAQTLVRFETCDPAWLLDRYNVALAQGVLYRAEALEIEIAGQSRTAYRALFRAIKFFQLLHRIRPHGDGYRIRLDGPVSVFGASGRYGLQMASFLPTLLHLGGWKLEAELRWGKRRFRRTFKLSADDALRPPGRGLKGQYLPEELRWLPDQIAALDCGWTVSTEAGLHDLGGEGVLVPDYVFEHTASGTEVLMEVFGFWNKGMVKTRLRQLRRHGPPNLIVALAKSLAAKAEEVDELPADLYVFRTAPVARSVRKLLRQYEP